MATNTEFLTLPKDVVISVLKKLTHENLIAVSLACKALYNISSTDSLWMNLCQHWQGSIDVKQWRSKLNSGKALFKLLKSFSTFIGCWTSRELSPRGGILYVKWGHLCLIASRIWTQSSGAIILKPLFEVVGLPDGSFKIQLYTGDPNFHFPVNLIWSSKEKVEFQFGLCKPIEASPSVHVRDKESDDESSSDISNEVTKMLRTSHLASMVKCLGPDHQVIGSQDETLDRIGNISREQLILRFLRPGGYQRTFIQDAESTSDPELLQGGHLRHRARQYLLQMYTFGNITPGTRSFLSSKRVNRSIYAKFKIDEPKPGQELAGLWSGIYGPHGMEIVNVSYTNEEIIATKLLGDPNVPFGEVTFKVTISSAIINARLHLAPGQEDGLDISRMYGGRGRIAGHNFDNPKWVPGRLLVQNNGNMAFLWEDVNFVIRFQRLNLESLHSESM